MFQSLLNCKIYVLDFYLASIVEYYRQYHSFVKILMSRYFFPAKEMPSLTQVITNAIANTALFSTCHWAVQNWFVFVADKFIF